MALLVRAILRSKTRSSTATSEAQMVKPTMLCQIRPSADPRTRQTSRHQPTREGRILCGKGKGMDVRLPCLFERRPERKAIPGAHPAVLFFRFGEQTETRKHFSWKGIGVSSSASRASHGSRERFTPSGED